MSASRLRFKLLAIVTQAWLIGGGATTALAAVLLSFVPGTGLGTGVVIAIAAAPVALIFSSPLYLLSLLITLPSPSFTVRARTPLCVGLPIIAVGALIFVFDAGVGGYAAPGIALLDASVAAFWCWRRSARLLGDGNAALRHTFG